MSCPRLGTLGRPSRPSPLPRPLEVVAFISRERREMGNNGGPSLTADPQAGSASTSDPGSSRASGRRRLCRLPLRLPWALGRPTCSRWPRTWPRQPSEPHSPAPLPSSANRRAGHPFGHLLHSVLSNGGGYKDKHGHSGHQVPSQGEDRLAKTTVPMGFI